MKRKIDVLKRQHKSLKRIVNLCTENNTLEEFIRGLICETVRAVMQGIKDEIDELTEREVTEE